MVRDRERGIQPVFALSRVTAFLRLLCFYRSFNYRFWFLMLCLFPATSVPVVCLSALDVKSLSFYDHFDVWQDA